MTEGEPNPQKRNTRTTVEYFPYVAKRPNDIPEGQLGYGSRSDVAIIKIEEVQENPLTKPSE